MIFRWVQHAFKKKVRSKVKVLDWQEQKMVLNQWQKIKELTEVRRASALKQAVIEADKLLDYVLEKMGYPGGSLADRLKAAQHRFKDYQGIWFAHKIRNRLVHDLHSEVLEYEIKEAIDRLEKGLKDLGALK
jgi:hypothetical protein